MGRDWIKKQKEEKFYKEAQKEGKRSRAAFKLRNIQIKFNILTDAKTVLDLCCAPGSWIQEIKQISTKISIIGIDIEKIQPINDLTFIQGDITDQTTISKLEEQVKQKIDVILSDCAPKITGMKETDYARHLFLVDGVMKIAHQFLKQGGHLVCKLFDGPETPRIRNKLKVFFESINLFKPDASRKASSELYLIGKFYKKAN